ncbi:MAG: hypothetical protein IKY52_07215, partial [Clostridia bacterium]|nr:hypothetical protein [Clostridia bacterium]
MKPEILMDAMEYIGEDLLEAAEKLRTGEKRNRSWMRWTSLAACMCLIAGGLFVWESVYGFGEEEHTGRTETGAAPTVGGETEVCIEDAIEETIAETEAGA